MLVARSLVGSFLALSLFTASCGGGAPTAPVVPQQPATAGEAPAQAPVDAGGAAVELGLASTRIARLIPSTTAIYIQIESFERFEALIGRLSRAHDAVGRQVEELNRQFLRVLPGDRRQLLANRPFGVAISLHDEREPQLTFVLPVKDATVYKRSLQLGPNIPQPVYDGSYLAVTCSSLYERPREPVELASGVPDQAMTVRLDLPRLEHRYGSQMRKALDAIAKGSELGELPEQVGAQLKQVADPLMFALAVGRQFELVLDIEADRLHLRCELETRDAGVLAGWTSSPAIDIAPLARSLVASDAIALVAGCDPSVLASRLAPLLTSTKPQAERLAGMLERFALPFGTLLGISGTLSPGDSHLSLYVNTSDHPDVARELASNFEMYSRGGLGLAVLEKTTVILEEVEVHDLLVRLDAASMCALTGEVAKSMPAVQSRLDGFTDHLFGADSVHVRVANFRGRGLIAIGNDDAWFRRTLLWAKQDKDLTPPDVAYALQHLGEVRAAAILRIDASRWEQGLTSWLAKSRALYEPVRLRATPGEGSVQALAPKPLTMAVGVEGRTLRLGLSLAMPSEVSPDMARR